VGLNPDRGLWNLSYAVAIQLAYGTSVVLLRCPFMPIIMHGRMKDVKPNKTNLSGVPLILLLLWPNLNSLRSRLIIKLL
jgi:hypothetical protein